MNKMTDSNSNSKVKQGGDERTAMTVQLARQGVSKEANTVSLMKRKWKNTLMQFSGSIRTGAEFAPDEIISPHYTAARGVEVYRNNYRGNLHDTLASAYPVIRQLVGEQFFRLLAKHYIEHHPSHSGNLHCYGSEMAKFPDAVSKILNTWFICPTWRDWNGRITKPILPLTLRRSILHV